MKGDICLLVVNDSFQFQSMVDLFFSPILILQFIYCVILHFIFRWRIVIHGAIDGFSRLVTFLEASDNNRSSTVMENFVKAVDQYGVPSRVRCDQGGENNAVCLFIEVFRGSARGSALRGRSTHNQRIERLWGRCLERCC